MVPSGVHRRSPLEDNVSLDGLNGFPGEYQVVGLEA